MKKYSSANGDKYTTYDKHILDAVLCCGRVHLFVRMSLYTSQIRHIPGNFYVQP
jgi:hypothetical protein